MTVKVHLLLRFLLCWLAIVSTLSMSTVQALPLIGGAPVASFELTTENNELATVLRARLKTYAEQHVGKKAATDPRVQREEMGIIKKQLQAEGYYAARVQTLRARHYRVDAGPRFTLRQWQIQSSAPHLAIDWPELPLKEGEPLRAQAVLAAREQLLNFLKARCYPKAKVDYDVLLDSRQHQGQLTLLPEPGPQAQIKAIVFDGLETVDEAYLRNLIRPAAGDCLRYAQLTQARLSLLQSGLLSTISYELQWPQEPENIDSQAVTVVFKVIERQNRSIKASVGYTTDAREGATLGWEHRNLFGGAEKLELEGGIDQISRSAKAELTLPQFYHPDQQLQLLFDIDTEEPDAYTSRSREMAAILSRDWSGGRRASIGVALTDSKIEETGESDERFSLLSLPIALGLDRRDDPVAARAGWAVDIALRPFTDLNQEELDFLQTGITFRTYFSQDEWWWRPTLALRASVGSLTGAPLESIPADQRFYVGGGGSVRGYPYQTVGELTDGEADGGKSFAETSVELRLHATENWGAVVFADGGYAYAEELPEFGEQFLWGAGLGLRYFTRFAPIRFDVAFPLNRREDVDNRFQLYISFGQAF